MCCLCAGVWVVVHMCSVDAVVCVVYVRVHVCGLLTACFSTTVALAGSAFFRYPIEELNKGVNF